MKKSLFSLAVAGSTLVSVIGSSPAWGDVCPSYWAGNAHDGAVAINGQCYSWVNTGPLRYVDNVGSFESSAQWGNKTLAQELANSIRYGVFAYSAPYSHYPYDQLDTYIYTGQPYYSAQPYRTTFKAEEPYTFVKQYGTPTPVPWDISGSVTIFGSITGIGLGVGLKRLKNRKNINIKE